MAHHAVSLFGVDQFPPGRQQHLDPWKKIMHCHLQVLTTPTVDTPGTGVILVFDQQRYFFGQIHEGFQRVGVESAAKFIKLKDAFITGIVGTQTIGGLLGMTLTLADVVKAKIESQKSQFLVKQERWDKLRQEAEERAARGKSVGSFVVSRPPTLETDIVSLGLHGGPNLTHVIAAARSFIFRQGVPLTVEEYPADTTGASSKHTDQATWSDEQIKVWTLAITPDLDADAASLPPSRRKRSLDEFMEGASDDDSPGEVSNEHGLPRNTRGEAESRRQKDQEVRQTIVREMFMSEWRSDNLVETALGEVMMPAKLFIRDPVSKRLEPFDRDPLMPPAEANKLKVLVRKPWPGALYHKLPRSSPSKTAMSYIVRNHKQRGKFNAEMAQKLGIPSGPLRGKLANGREVVLETGQTITPDMVMTPDKEGEGFAVFDLPSAQYVTALEERLSVEGSDIMAGVGLCVWLLGPGVAQHQCFQRLVKKYQDLQHVVASSDTGTNQLSMRTAATTAFKHRVIDARRFPELVYDNENAVSEISGSENIHIARPGLRYHIQPSFRIDRELLPPPLDFSAAGSLISWKVRRASKKAADEVERAQALTSPEASRCPSDDAEITFLGTGSAQPSLHRNVSATLLRVPGQGTYLFDAGENTLGQLRRRFNPAEVSDILQDLKMIWISHLHADHHLGTIAVIKAWHEEIVKAGLIPRLESVQNFDTDRRRSLEEAGKLVVVGHPQMLRYLQEFSSVEDYGFDRLTLLKPTPAQAPNWDKCELEYRNEDVGFNTCQNEDL